MRLIVVDDSIIIREGLRQLLESERHHVIEMISEPGQVASAVAAGSPDAVVIDIRMPPTFTDEGIEVALRLRAATPTLPVLVLSQYAIPEYATRLIRSGARGVGYLLKERILQPLQLSQALERLSVGGTVVDPDVVGELLAAPSNNERLSRLSGRELEVLQLIAEGLSDKGIADRLFISPHTVNTHIAHIFHKLHLPEGAHGNRRVLAVLAYLQQDKC